MVKDIYMNKMIKFDYTTKNKSLLAKDKPNEDIKDGNDNEVVTNPTRTPEV